MNSRMINKTASLLVTALLLAHMAIWATACSNPTNDSSVQHDTTTKINVYPTDSNVPVDTDNHNVGTTSTVTLDSTVGPPPHLDTTKLIEPPKR